MKHFVSFITFLLALGFASCNPNGPEWSEQYREASCVVVKFIPEAALYRQDVMLVLNPKGEYRMRDLATGGTCREFFMGHSPFMKIDSTGSWYLSDWKWNVLLSYSHVVIPLRWADVRKPDESYVRSDFDIAASGIIQKYSTIKRSEIDRYLGITPAPAAEYAGPWGRTSGGISTDHLAPVYLNRYYSTQDIPEVIDRKGEWKYTKDDFLKERKRQDSLQSVYRDRLEQLVYLGADKILF